MIPKAPQAPSLYIINCQKLITMQYSIQHLTYNYTQPQKIRQLNLSSTTNIKIYQIKHLDNFIRLRTLILTNNMITVINGLEMLTQLRVLNLEFNRIRVVEGTQQLAQLEEMYLGYNEIEYISDSVISNPKLRILHLAYNDIKVLDSISVLYQIDPSSSQPTPNNYYLPFLHTLSLYGNPITSTINYLSFFKMLIPSLRVMDDKSVSDDMMVLGGGVCPQEEVIILREAINKLLDERNQAVQQLESYAEKETEREVGKSDNKKQKKKQVSPIKQVPSQNQQRNNKIARFNHQIIKYFECTKQKYTVLLQDQRQKISKISQLYTQNLKRNKQHKNNESFDYIQQLSPGDDNFQDDRSPASMEQGWMDNNKEIIKELKLEDGKLQEVQEKIRAINRVLSYIQQRVKGQEEPDVYKIVLEVVLFGFELNESLNINNCQKLCKKYLIKSSSHTSEGQPQINSGLIQYSEILKKVIYGQNGSKGEVNQILKLKTKIRSKGLLEIITQLKQFNIQESSKYSKFEKQKKDFIQQFQKESEELSRSWDQLRRQKEKYQTQKKKEQRQIVEQMSKKEQQMRKKYKIVEEQQRQKITELKRSRQRLQDDQERIKLELAETEERLNRKFMELEEFQTHFNQFIGQKQHIKSLEDEINDITNSMHLQKIKYENLVDKVKQLTLEEGIIQNKLNKCSEVLIQKNDDLKQLELLKNQTIRLYEKYKHEVDKENQKLRDLSSAVNKKIEQMKDYEKMSQRTKKNLILMEQKARNLEQMEQGKKMALKQLDQSLKQLKEDKEALLNQTDSLQKNMQIKRQQLIRCQLKIQQNRLAMQNLSDLNKSISDMMIRQSQLKRSIIELEIENKNLLEMKNNLVGDFRMKNYL